MQAQQVRAVAEAERQAWKRGRQEGADDERRDAAEVLARAREEAAGAAEGIRQELVAARQQLADAESAHEAQLQAVRENSASESGVAAREAAAHLQQMEE